MPVETFTQGVDRAYTDITVHHTKHCNGERREGLVLGRRLRVMLQRQVPGVTPESLFLLVDISFPVEWTYPHREPGMFSAADVQKSDM